MTYGSGGRAGYLTFRMRLPVLLAGTLVVFLFSVPGLTEESTPQADRSKPDATLYAVPDAGVTAALESEWDALAGTTIELTISDNERAGDGLRRLELRTPENADPDGSILRLVALPECDGATVSGVILSPAAGRRRQLDAGDHRLARVEDVVRIREQTVAIVAIDSRGIADEMTRLGLSGNIQIVVDPINASGPVSNNTGPFTRALTGAILNYRASGDQVPSWEPPSSSEGRSRGAAIYCSSVADCQNARIDMMLIVADRLYTSPLLSPYANYMATYLDLNVGVVSTSALPELTPEALRSFIQDVYETRSAANFGDGHLGFVTLVGDAYADDNQTVMIPAYDGYGFTEVASDHYYACVSGDDDFEDVMIGRLPVGNSSELVRVAGKTLGYMPLPENEDWCKRVLLVAGTFYASKDSYVNLFDSYEALIPGDWAVDRIYRHDFSTDAECIETVVDGFDAGALFVNYAGDGWISSWYETFKATNISQLSNGDRLPIVLSMACETGWFDNITEADQNGSYDCLAEQLVNAPNKGAIACLAAPRASDGGAFSTLTEKIYQSVFTEKCTFLGETMAVAKLLHLQDSGSVTYARHYNLFGDPALIYRWDTEPYLKPELSIRPHETSIDNKLPGVGDDVTVTVRVRNESTLPVTNAKLRVTRVSEAGSHYYDTVLPSMSDWSSEVVAVVVPSLASGWNSIIVTVDPDGAISETDETNNSFAFDIFVYPHADGFPVESGSSPYGPCVANLDDLGTHIVLMGSDARVIAIDDAGQTAWITDAMMDPLFFGPEVAPVVGDIDGDGIEEVIATRLSGLAAFDVDGGILWQIGTQDPVGSPVLADADRDGDLDILLATHSFFGNGSQVVAIDENGGTIWSYDMPQDSQISATPVAGDFDQDGYVDFAYASEEGLVGAASCSQMPPALLWGPVQVNGAVTQLGLADLDDDGVLELMVAGRSAHCLNAEDGTQRWMATPGTGIAAFSLGDIDADGVPEAVVAAEDGTVYMLDKGFPKWSSSLSGSPLASIAMADVRDDSGVELITVTDDGLLRILDSSGRQQISPIPIPGVNSSPFVEDLDGDGKLEVCVASPGEGRVFAFTFASDSVGDPAVEWQGIGANAAHTGVMVQPFAGSITSDVALFGNYVFAGDVLVEEGATLSIMPGAVLEFGGPMAPELEVAGTLEALGLPRDPIIMKPVSERGTGVWKGIKAIEGASVYLSSCELSGATKGINGNKANVSLENCSFSSNTYGAYLTGCTLDAADCSFSLSGETGMLLNGGSGDIAGCSFESNYKSGLRLDYSATHHISGSLFSDTIDGDGLGCYRHSDAAIDSCVFIGNSRNGAAVQSSNPVFFACTLSSNSQSGLYCHKEAEPSLSWCTVTGNKTGVSSYGDSDPHLGDDANANTGYNSIYGNAGAAVANCSGTISPILAKYNWWGSDAPDVSQFFGYVTYVPYLTAPPEPGRATAADTAEEDETVPTSFRLAGNVPNPFNPKTSIEFDVPSGGARLDLSVFDVAGRRVATLYSGYHEQGTHRVVWDGRENSGREVASGIYFARLEASGFSAATKMILLK